MEPLVTFSIHVTLLPFGGKESNSARCHVSPCCSRGVIRKVWKTVLLKTGRTHESQHEHSSWLQEATGDILAKKNKNKNKNVALMWPFQDK